VPLLYIFHLPLDSTLFPYTTLFRSYDEHRFPDSHHADLLLAGESRPALQSVVCDPAAGVLPGTRAAARARRALDPQRRGRDPAGPVHRRGGRVGPAPLHALPARRGVVVW